MNLNKCYIFSFGKLNDVTFDFSCGLNTFKEDNGWGKSTLASFIKCIFYGLNDSKKSVAENERLKFKPWNSTQKFGGYIEFTWGGKQFKLERYFGSKANEDTVSLIDLNTGKSFPNTENLGGRIFQIDEEGFLSTTYFSQKDFQVKSNTSLTAKFNSVCEIQDTEAFDKALTKLEEKAKQYKKTGDKGLLADTKREIFAVGAEIQSANLAGKTAESLSVGVKNLETEVENLKFKTADLTKKVTEAGRIETIALKKSQFDSYSLKKSQKTQEKTRLEALLNGQRPSEKEIGAYFDCCNELNKVIEREAILENDIQALKSQQVTVNKTAKSNFTPTLILVIIALSFTVFASVILFFDLLWLSVILYSLSAIGGIVALLLRFTQSKKGEAIENSNQSYVEQKIRDYDEYKKIRQNYEQKIDEFLAKFNAKASDRFLALSQISSAVKSVIAIDLELKEIDQAIASFGAEKIDFNLPENALNIHDLRRELALVQDEYTIKANELAKKRSDIRFYQEKADALAELENKKAELLNRQEEYKEEYSILLKTLEFLSKADENLKVKYRAPLQESLNKYLSMITGNNKKANIDIDLKVSIEENGGAKQPEYYSKGEQNLFEICKRFALTDVLFTGEKPFIILDDPFYNLDDEKLKVSLELIKKLSNEYQILYFVCHESRRA